MKENKYPQLIHPNPIFAIIRFVVSFFKMAYHFASPGNNDTNDAQQLKFVLENSFPVSVTGIKERKKEKKIIEETHKHFAFNPFI